MSCTIDFTASATLEEWVFSGFEVSVSWQTGNDYEYNGAIGEAGCVMQRLRIQHTPWTFTIIMSVPEPHLMQSRSPRLRTRIIMVVGTTVNDSFVAHRVLSGGRTFGGAPAGTPP